MSACTLRFPELPVNKLLVEWSLLLSRGTQKARTRRRELNHMLPWHLSETSAVHRCRQLSNP